MFTILFSASLFSLVSHSSLLYKTLSRKMKTSIDQEASHYSPVKFIEYKLISNDNLWDISRKKGLQIDSIVSINKLKNNHVIREGTIIYLPNIDGILVKDNSSNAIDNLSKKYNISSEIIYFFNSTNTIIPHPLGVSNFFLPGVSYSLRERSAILGMEFLSPIYSTWITGRWGIRIHPLTKKRSFHKGIDLGGQIGEKVYSSMAGRIIFASSAYGYGKMVIMKHRGGYETRYAHLNAICVKVGQKIPNQTPIGEVGQTGHVTGPHLHFEVRKNGKSIDPKKVANLRMRKR